MDNGWTDGRSVGVVERRFFSFGSVAEPFRLQRGGDLPGVTLAYETYGRLNDRRDNVILILHALTGDAHAAGWHSPTDRKPGWWDGAIGPGKAIDTHHWFVVCSNVVGGCQGSTGPRGIDPRTGRRYNLRFPLVTVRDMVRAQRRLIEHLGIRRLRAVIGGSIGGMQALEWAVTYPDLVDLTIVLAATARFHAQGIAYNEVQRRAIMLDPRWRGGEYEDGEGPAEGLAIARMLGMISYQSDPLMTARFDRRPATRPSAWPEFGDHFDVEGYLHYQGDALTRRYDANTYLYLSRAMDLHDVSLGHPSYEAALARITSRVWLLGVTTDILFPDSHVQALANDLVRVGAPVEYWQLDSIHGHDAFLVEFEQMEPLLRRYLEHGTLTLGSRPAPTEPRPTTGRAELATAAAGLGQHFRHLDGDYE